MENIYSPEKESKYHYVFGTPPKQSFSDTSDNITDKLSLVMKRRLGNDVSTEGHIVQTGLSANKKIRLETGSHNSGEYIGLQIDEVDGSFGNDAQNKNMPAGNFELGGSSVMKVIPLGDKSKSEQIGAMSEDQRQDAVLAVGNLSSPSDSESPDNSESHTSEVHKGVSLPDSDNESDSVPFAITCFQSLNAEYEDTCESVPEMANKYSDKNHAAGDMSTPEISNSEADNETPESSNQGLFEVYVDIAADDESQSSYSNGFMVKERVKADNTDKPVTNEDALDNSITADLNEMVDCDSNAEKSHTVTNTRDEQVEMEGSSLKVKKEETGIVDEDVVREVDDYPQKSETNNIDSMAGDSSNDFDKSDIKVKTESKKSRKQTVPRRHLRVGETEEILDDQVKEGDNDIVDNVKSRQNDSGKRENAPTLEPVKCEKSRKQANPRRISVDIIDGAKDTNNASEKMEEADHAIKIQKEGDMATQNNSHDSKDTTTQGLSFTGGFSTPSPSLISNIASFDPRSLAALNFHPGNLDLYSKLSPSLLSAGASPNYFMGSSDELANMEVIRQLREIRCTKYRKISVAEKKEIAEYAKSNGVSQAANVYNVSKSAVSMWTRTDLDELEEQDEKRKKNCMLGNERFEKLCAKVRAQREHKFKGLSKSDKFEVSRYAKLVGVREMSRCLDVALGTVSGWMRQFPYKLNVGNPDDGETESKESNPEDTNENEDKTKNNIETVPDVSGKQSKASRKKGKESKKTSKSAECSEKSAEDSSEVSEANDEVDNMIVENMYKLPDIEELYNNVQDLMTGTELEGDEDFKSLFARVVQCKVHKYKTLSPADKISVCLYGRRVGVRKVGRVLGLATGTLSGWNSKYNIYMSGDVAGTQLDLSVNSDSCDMDSSRETTNDCLDTSATHDESVIQSPSTSAPKSMATLEAEKSEVMAVKCLMKDRFEGMCQKIGIARTMKFRNISVEEKIEIVKCSKLVGIRPTARVLNIPIGTLSGWITKYSNKLHPVYNLNEDDSSMYGDIYSNPGLQYMGFGTDPSSMWSSGLVPNPNLDFSKADSEVRNMAVYPGLPSFYNMNNEAENSDVSLNDDNSQSGSAVIKVEEGNSDNTEANNIGSSDTVAMETGSNLENEAKQLAQQYMQAAYKHMGLPML